LFLGGYKEAPATAYNNIDYITIASTGNATDFGDLIAAMLYNQGCASDTRGLSGGGSGEVSNIDYVTIATTGNASDFGDLTLGRANPGSFSSLILGVWCGGIYAEPHTNVIDYITIASTGNATDFGDLTFAKMWGASCSSAHGGLA